MSQYNRKAAEMALSRREDCVPLTPEAIDSYLEYLRGIGRTQGTIDNYSRRLGWMYRSLPEGSKVIGQETLLQWREKLAKEGYTSAVINQCMIAANGYLEYQGVREFQMIDRLNESSVPRPELTRSEYLRLLSAARVLGRKQVYLMVKVFGNSDLPVQELKNLTVEAAQAGMVSVSYNYSKEIIRFPGSLCRELLEYAQGQGIRSGPIFLTRNGKTINRTNVTLAIRRLCATAQVPEEKGNPRCLRKLYQSTRADMERNIILLVEQAQDRLLEEEQLAIGWNQ